MKTKKHNSSKHQKDHKIMQISQFTELSDSELEIVVGGWGTPLQPPPPGGTGGGCTGFIVLGSI